MKTAIVYNPNAHKLRPDSYSQTFRDMLLALIREFKPQHITEGCSAKDIDADMIIFFDPHSTHHIEIDGIENHGAIKYEFMDDPHQVTMFGQHITTGVKFLKLGAGARIHRAYKRGINFIISPHKQSYYRFFGPYLGEDADRMLVWFPPAPESLKDRGITVPPIYPNRKLGVLANGALKSASWLGAYDFRKRVFSSPLVSFIPHCIEQPSEYKGKDYYKLPLQYAGALALCDIQLCPKHVELPMAGCLTFVQPIDDVMEMGFVHYKNCIYIYHKTFEDEIQRFLSCMREPGYTAIKEFYKRIANAGRELVENKYTAKHFAKFIRKHYEKVVNPKTK